MIYCQELHVASAASGNYRGNCCLDATKLYQSETEHHDHILRHLQVRQGTRLREIKHRTYHVRAGQSTQAYCSLTAAKAQFSQTRNKSI